MAKKAVATAPEDFIGELVKDKLPVTVFLINGVKLQGIISWTDDSTMLLKRDGHTQLVYKHAVSTIMPNSAVETKED